jgi:ATP-dependent DNA helicase DinG
VDRIILDEAHSLESIASEYLGQRITRRGIGRLLHAAWNPRTRRGIVRGTPYEGAVARAVEEAEAAADRLFGDLLAIRGTEAVIRLREPARVEDALASGLRHVGDALAPLVGHAASEEEETEIRAVMDRFEATATALTDLLSQEAEGHVYWLEREEIRSAPIHVGPILREWIFERYGGVVLTSATLSVGGEGGFDYIRDRLGVPDPVERVLGSPFRYREQVRIVVPRDLPEPTEGEAFLEAAADRIRRYLDLAGGRAFVLFTSHSHMRRVREMLRSFFQEKGIACYSQGEGLPRGKMLDRFREDVRSVLFGVDSFWEGVDVPGEALSNVIIVKIPFQVPTRPLVEARADEVRARGEDPFRIVSLPEAALRLRQGFGRLVRSQRDRGIVAILDTRIHRREYGRFLMQALPDCEILTDWPDDGEAP